VITRFSVWFVSIILTDRKAPDPISFGFLQEAVMKRIRTFTAAVALAMVMAGGLTLGVAPAEAGGKKGGGNAQEAICAYLLQVITYEYVNPLIKQTATQLYLSYGCDPSKLPS
jgi:hypothetical protein